MTPFPPTGLRNGLIINADDLGAHPATSAGIRSAYEHGILSSATIMVTTDHLEDAIRNVVRPTGIPTGLHVDLVEGRCASDPSLISDLAHEDGRFKRSARQLITMGAAGFRRNGLDRQIRAEVRAQLTRASDWGITLTHVDSHQHTHMNPHILNIVQDEAESFGIRAMRFSREPLIWQLSGIHVGSVLARRNPLKWAVLRWRSFGVRPRLETPDHFFGIMHSGIFDAPVLHAVLQRIRPDACVEIGMHPGYAAETAASAFTSSPMRRAELDALIDSEAVDIIRQRRLALISFSGKVK